MGIIRTLPPSPANAWIRHVTEVHLSEVSLAGKVADEAPPKQAAALVQKIQALTGEMGTLRAYRAVSPY